MCMYLQVHLSSFSGNWRNPSFLLSISVRHCRQAVSSFPCYKFTITVLSIELLSYDWVHIAFCPVDTWCSLSTGKAVRVWTFVSILYHLYAFMTCFLGTGAISTFTFTISGYYFYVLCVRCIMNILWMSYAPVISETIDEFNWNLILGGLQ